MQEIFFCRVNEDKMSQASNQGIFYPTIPSQDILYNVKSFFPIEQNLISKVEEKIKREKEELIKQFKIY